MGQGPETQMASLSSSVRKPSPVSPSSSSIHSSLHQFYTDALIGNTKIPPPHASMTPDPFPPDGGIGTTGKGILIGILSAFSSAFVVGFIILLVYFFRYTPRGRILLDRIGRPGEFDDEQAFAQEEAEALEEMDELQRAEYMRAKAFVQANPPESIQTDISLSQFLAIQEKGVSAWEFEPELEIANCFVEARTEIEFFDAECSVQSNLPVPKQNEVYYWEAKIFDKPENTQISIGMTTKPYPLFRMPGYHKTSVAYTSPGSRRFNQPFTPQANYGPAYVRGDVIGCGYRPRTGTVFFTRNGKKLEDVTNTLKTQNLFPTVGANGPCVVHVNFGQYGYVFLEANVKKWGLAPMTGSLAPPPPYGSEQGSILLQGGQHGMPEGQGWLNAGYHSGASAGWGDRRMGHSRTRSAQARLGRQPPSPGPQRSPTDISLSQLSLIDAMETDDEEEDIGEGTSGSMHTGLSANFQSVSGNTLIVDSETLAEAPPEYQSPSEEEAPSSSGFLSHGGDEERRRLLLSQPIPSYDAAISGREGPVFRSPAAANHGVAERVNDSGDDSGDGSDDSETHTDDDE